jgi:hypothetical protein
MVFDQRPGIEPDPIRQTWAGTQAATAAQTHQRIAQGTATLRDADARYRPAAAGRISTTPTTQKPRISGARGVRGSSHAAESASQVPPYSLRLTALLIAPYGRDGARFNAEVQVLTRAHRRGLWCSISGQVLNLTPLFRLVLRLPNEFHAITLRKIFKSR